MCLWIGKYKNAESLQINNKFNEIMTLNPTRFSTKLNKLILKIWKNQDRPRVD